VERCTFHIRWLVWGTSMWMAAPCRGEPSRSAVSCRA
jgi:hypothetical protein